MPRPYPRFIAALALVLLMLIASPAHPNGASSSDFANANAVIASAFSAVNAAELRGGNVSLLVAQLNGALSLVQKAQAENASNPAQALIDLQGALRIAQQVSSQAPGVGLSGAAAKETFQAESIAGILAIVIVGVLVYIYGGKIYRLIWLMVYRNHLVKRESG